MLIQEKKSNRDNRKAFTLVEIMLVLFILMSLATVGIISVRTMSAQAKKRQAAVGVGEYARALESFYSIYDRYPTADEGLDALRNCPASIDQNDYDPIIKSAIKPDPWGMPYNYQYPSSRGGDGFDLWSNGPDMNPGTDDDIYAE